MEGNTPLFIGRVCSGQHENIGIASVEFSDDSSCSVALFGSGIFALKPARSAEKAGHANEKDKAEFDMTGRSRHPRLHLFKAASQIPGFPLHRELLFRSNHFNPGPSRGFRQLLSPRLFVRRNEPKVSHCLAVLSRLVP